ncbi:PREDICTED: uncharacterized protein LOC108562079 [Nicrophorus vespilloides]|uniref:Uncharacterized protein LOC108562079 n=1 Tax=Nicrophorus vespilloides TaxID=110193 RepID=A0ABM1MMH3_NICVS|nr:PREDICTED: uncharacterized protein LOC108562079 [Nicrophorus vespilloides]
MYDFAKSLVRTAWVGGRVFLKCLKKSLLEEIEQSRQLAKARYEDQRERRIADSGNHSKELKISLQEAKMILDVTDEVQLLEEKIEENYARLFDANTKTSLYLLSKVVRARERILLELKTRKPAERIKQIKYKL